MAPYIDPDAVSDCALCKLVDGIGRGVGDDETLAPALLRLAFLCGVATGEYLAYRRSADVCERCAGDLFAARGMIQKALAR